jgi:hypothetical protein
MDLQGNQSKNSNFDGKGYHCKSCFTRKSIRHSSFIDSCSTSIQEFVRCAFYYFIKNYEADLAHREMTENALDGVGIGSGKSSVFSVYALC